MAGCDCALRPKNLGRPNCVETRGVSNGMVLALWKNSDGDVNSIPNGTVINQAYVEGKFNETDFTKQWFITPRNYRVVSERAEDKKEDVEGVMKRTGEKGVRTRAFELLGKDATPEILAALESFQCRDLGFLDLTKKGQVWGTNTGDGNLLFTRIEADTFEVNAVYATDGVIQKITVMFAIDETEIDSEQDYIPSSDIDYATRFWYTSAPLEVAIVEVDSSQLDEITVALKWFRNDFAGNQAITDFVLNDFNTNGVATVYNVTDSSTVSLTTVVESSTVPGQYTLTLASAQTDQDYIKIDIVKDGYAAEPLYVYIGPTT